MTTPQQRAANTRRLYAFEATVLKLNPYLSMQRNKLWLVEQSRYIWIVERGSIFGCPELYFNDALKLSYSQSGHGIHFAKDQHDLMTLIHELAHALGPEHEEVHGGSFVARYFSMLVDHGQLDPDELAMNATMFGIKCKRNYAYPDR